MYSKIQQRKKQKEVIYIVWLQTYQHLTWCKTGLIMHPIMTQTKKQWVWILNPLKTCLRHKIPMTLVEFFHRYWLSLSGEWSSVNIKYGLLWSSTPWYGGLWQGDQKPPKPNLSPIFYQLFFYGSCRTMYLRWIYIKYIGVLRDTARAPQPPTSPPTGHQMSRQSPAENDQECNFWAKLCRFRAKILIFTGERKVLLPT